MKFDRLNPQHFAELANNNGIFGSAQQSNNNSGQVTSDYSQIPSLPAFKQGWNEATITSKALPPLEEMQGLQSYYSYLINYLYQQGIAPWSSTYTYYVGNMAVVIDSGTNKLRMFSSLTNDNTGNNPLTDTTNWDEKFFFDSSFQAALAAKMDTSPAIVSISGASGTIQLQANTCYYIVATAAVTFSLPGISGATNLSWIRVNLVMEPAVPVDLGTTHFYSGGAPDMADPGSYLILYSTYPNPTANIWLCDAIGPAS